MRKLLILMLVLGLASLADAAILELSVDGDTGVDEVTILKSSTITIDVACTGSVDEDEFWLGLEPVDGSGEWYRETATIYQPPEYPEGPALDLAFSDGGFGDLWFYVYKEKATIGSKEGVWFDVVYHCTSPDGDVLINLYDEGGGTVEDSILVHQIPEPATIALLGLGSLFLLRRRK